MGRARPTIGARSPHTFSTSSNPSEICKENFEIIERCKGVLCVDLGEISPTTIYLQNLAFDTAKNEPYYFEISSSREFEFDFELTNRLFATQAALAIPLRGKTNGIAEVMRIRAFAAPLPASTLTFHTAPIAPRPSNATWLFFREPEAFMTCGGSQR